ncbi:hypothetical protein L0657_17600 [Dyadobacter sp. CY345]|uniref:hypothetical protein n=1 Tax=Dyadobacter sp. CY345 TaxID=2909335 RepID=UPI001F37402C|nr:hypothetical protein [Dyadobacter sp. CY345]MCF2445780.1 hypothetical protein [Dyadobacter sp. CY345]
MSKYLYLVVGIFISTTFGYILFTNSQNIPSFDDYDATLAFIRNFYFEKSTDPERLGMLFDLHNEHCIMISRLSASIYYAIFKEINFTHLVLYQNLFLLGFYAVILAIMKQQNLLSPLAALFVTIFLFSLSFWQVSFYYWAGIQHYTVLFFSFLSLFLLSKAEKPNGKYFILACLFASLAIFSFGNGVLALFLGGFLLFVQKKKSALVVWIVVSLLLLSFLYFSRTTGNGSEAEAFNFEWMGRLLFTFLGSFLFVNPPDIFWYKANIIFCMITGLAVLSCWIVLFLNGYAFKNPLLYVLFSFPILTGIVIAISRFSTKAAGGIAPRYMFFTATIPVILLLILLDMGFLKKRVLQYITFSAFLVWSLSFNNNLKVLKQSNEELMISVKKSENNKDIPLINGGNGLDYSAKLHWAIENNVIKIPKYEE